MKKYDRRNFFKLSGMGLLSVAVTSTFGLTSAFATATTYTFPPEWAPQASVWLCWDSTDDLHRTTDAAMHAVTAQIVEALHSKNTKVDMIVSGDAAKADCLNFLNNYQVDPQKSDFITIRKVTYSCGIWGRCSLKRRTAIQ
ncbi:agmatine deiminase family protein [Undibacterium arcticum]|uniref:agmatine deiminase family protein n=1 Tax=Undibacterium arcticum TaxID=1762892 RepID=UPI003606F5BF